LVLQSEVVPLAIPIGKLTSSVSASGDSDLAVEISWVLDISLSEMQAQYFGDSDKSNELERRLQDEWDHLWDDLQERERFKENCRRRREEAEVRSYCEDNTF
jgi:hypothetical protein